MYVKKPVENITWDIFTIFFLNAKPQVKTSVMIVLWFCKMIIGTRYNCTVYGQLFLRKSKD